MTGIIYVAVNKVNGKIYVGQTTRKLKVRSAEHFTDPRPFGKALRKYGTDSFEITVIEYCSTKEELDRKEIYWISALQSMKPNGYNISTGGDGTPGIKRPDTAARNKALVGEKNHMSKRTGELNPFYGKGYINAGENNPMYGKRLSDEKKRLISERTKAAMQRPEVREKHLKGIATKKDPEGWKKKLSESRKILWLNEAYRKKMQEVSQSPEARKKRSESVKKTVSAKRGAL